MGYRIKRTLNEELDRINEIIIGNESQLLTEGVDPKVRKVVGDVVGEIFTPDGLRNMFKKLKFDDFNLVTKNITDNFDVLRSIAKTDNSWNDVISNAQVLHSVPELFDAQTGKLLTPDEAEVVYKTDIEGILDGSRYYEEFKHYHLVNDEWVEITTEAFEELKKASGMYYKMPPFLRHSAAEVQAALKSAGGTFKSIDEFLIALKGFMRGTTGMTPELRKALIALMSNTPGFAKVITDGLIANDKFYKYTKLYRSMGKLSDLNDAVEEVLGLAKGSKLLDDIDNLLSKEGVLIGEWLDFVFQAWKPLQAIDKFRFGLTTSKWRTLMSDVVMGSFFDYVMGAQILKSMYASIRKLAKLPLVSVKGNSIAAAVILMWVMVGGYKTVRDWSFDVTNWDPKKMFDDVIDLFTQYCVGDNKVKDALTGDLYANVVGDKSDADGTRTTCGPVEFNTKFLQKYTIQNEDTVKAAAETLYRSLNIDSFEDHPLVLWGYVPSLTKIFREYTGAFTADDDKVKSVLFEDGMDIMKLSQISDYYETNFDASLIDDMKNLDYWREIWGGMNFEMAKTEIMKLPYLDPGQGDLNFDTWKEVVEENEKLFLTYPSMISFEVDVEGQQMVKQIKLAKCGANCKDDNNNECNCNDGGCNLGGELVSVSMGVALEAKGYDDQEKLNALCKLDTGFDTLEEIFNETMNPTGTGCVLRRGR